MLIYTDGNCEDISKKVSDYVEELGLEELIGQKIIIGTPWKYNNENSDMSKAERKLTVLITKYRIGNFFLCDQNYRDWLAYEESCKEIEKEHLNLETIVKQTDYLHKESKIPPIIANDFEGGLVQHFRGKGSIKSQTPSPMCFTLLQDTKKINKFGQLIGKLYKSLGLTTNFAPILDRTNEDIVTLIGTRSFSSNSKLVEFMAKKFSYGMLDFGISPVFKHWPGLGFQLNSIKDFNLNLDLHEYDKPLIFKQNLEINSRIFKNIFSDKNIKNYAAIMTSHVIIESYDNDIVTFSKRIIEYLRRQLKIDDCVIISDDFAYLNSINKCHNDLGVSLTRAVESGHDMIIIGSLLPKYSLGQKIWEINTVIKALDKLHKNFKGQEKKLKKSVKRILKWKYNIYKKLYGVSNFEQFLHFDYSKEKKVFDFKKIKKDMQMLTEDVLQNAIVIIGPANINPKNLASKTKTKLEHLHAEIVSVAPTYNTDDLKQCILNLTGNSPKDFQLPYKDKDLKEDDDLIKEPNKLTTSKSDTIINHLKDNDCDIMIFGIVEKPAHIKILEKVYEKYINNEFKSKKFPFVIVAFCSPAIFNYPFFNNVTENKNVILISTYSNSYYSNSLLIKTLLGSNIAREIIYSPVRNNNYLPEVDISWLPEEAANPISKLLESIKYSINSIINILCAFFLLWKISNKNLLLTIVSILLGISFYFFVCPPEVYTSILLKLIPPIIQDQLTSIWQWVGILISAMIACAITVSVFSVVSSCYNKLTNRG